MILFLFESTHAVIAAEKICVGAQIPCAVIPVPRSISSQCGLCIEAAVADREPVAALLRESGIIFTIHEGYVK
ncbi:MAG TPA: DUF3343 domain-containing protein [bacterium]|nr:DUF3343 domain-containing protein [bacterium]